MFNLRKDLIEKELNSKEGVNFEYFELTDTFLDMLFENYYVREMVENYYDSEPSELEDDSNDEIFNMFLDYKESITITPLSLWKCLNIETKSDNKAKFSKQEHTEQELKDAYDLVTKWYSDYEEKRLEFCSWQELHGDGIWDRTQKDVDKFARETLVEIKDNDIQKKGRLYFGKKDNLLYIYWYGRDYLSIDYWFIFQRKGS